MEEEEKLLLLFAIMVVVLRIHSSNGRLRLTVRHRNHGFILDFLKETEARRRHRLSGHFAASPMVPMLPPSLPSRYLFEIRGGNGANQLREP